MGGGRWVPCCSCKQPIWMDPGHEKILRKTNQNWFCLWGHAQHFPAGPTSEDTLRQERDRLRQNAAYLKDRVQRQRELRKTAERRASAARGQVTRLKNRAAAGACPCCNRSFENLRRHMSAKHKGFALEKTAPIEATVQ